ncbi:uncharacterized protein G2W53_008610 [Senna tora]|uniref:Uncharacterized protein n=1 Tax=Senna tora TaxID=362788 RepID=A0A834X796_9FABA|nr:uncharacterized protein G2W53_008610 [Senna tora]
MAQIPRKRVWPARFRSLTQECQIESEKESRRHGQ